MFTRRIGAILRGKATPAQLAMACILGSLLGFVPGFVQGPGLILALTFLLIVLNANLGVAALVGLLAKLASLALMPVSFEVGTWLIDGPTQGLFATIINAPVLALFGFEYYATTGGVVLGLVFGIVAAAVAVGLVNGFRRKMATLEEGSEAYRKYMSKWWAKLLIFLFVGGGTGKLTYKDLLARRIGNPIRPIGVVFVLLVAGLLVLVQMFASGPIVTALAKRGLEDANGATVDIGGAELDLRNNKLVLTGLAMADANDLKTDLLRAERLEADISATDLLRKRMTIDRVVVSEATHGEARSIPGRLVGPPPEPTREPVETGPGEKTIEDYIAEAKVWKERLAQAREWLERISKETKDVKTGPGGEGGRRETLRERLEREVREKGYTRVTASHLVEGAPTLLVREVIAEGVRAPKLEGEVLDVRGENLSTQPWLVAEAPSVVVTSRSGNIATSVRLGEAAGVKSPSTLAFLYKGLPVDAVAGSLAVGGTRPIQGGTMDLALDGSWGARGVGYLDLPLNVTLHGTTVSLPEAGSAEVQELVLPIGLRGPMDDPRITIDQDQLADALVKAGAAELAGRVRGEAEAAAQKAIDKATGEVTGKVQDELGEKAKGVLGGLLDRKKDKKKEEPK